MFLFLSLRIKKIVQRLIHKDIRQKVSVLHVRGRTDDGIRRVRLEVLTECQGVRFFGWVGGLVR